MNNHFDTEVKLRKVKRTQDANGYFNNTPTDSNVWGDLRSATRSEFYSAEAQGHKIVYILTVNVIDFPDGAEQAIIDGKTYNIVRTYQKTLDLMDLSLERI